LGIELLQTMMIIMRLYRANVTYISSVFMWRNCYKSKTRGIIKNY